MKNLMKFGLVAVLTLVFAACSNDDDNTGDPVNPQTTIVDLLRSNPDYDNLVAG